MKTIVVRLITVLVVVTSLWGFAGAKKLKSKLSGFNEVPAVVTAGSGALILAVSDEGILVDELVYENLEGAICTGASEAHVSRDVAFTGQREVLGGQLNPLPLGKHLDCCLD